MNKVAGCGKSVTALTTQHTVWRVELNYYFGKSIFPYSEMNW